MRQLPTNLEALIDYVVGSNPDGEPLELLTDAVVLSGRLGDLADDLVDHFVHNARDSGASWADVGQSIGVSKQAAQKRFVGGGAHVRSRRGLFTRFAGDAKAAVREASRQATIRGSDFVGTTHIVLGLTADPESLGSRAIESTGAARRAIREDAAGTVEAGTADRSGHIPFSPGSKKVLELSLREAIRSGSRHIGSDHILLGLLRDVKLEGTKLLISHGVTRKAVEEWLDSQPVNDR